MKNSKQFTILFWILPEWELYSTVVPLVAKSNDIIGHILPVLFVFAENVIYFKFVD